MDNILKMEERVKKIEELAIRVTELTETNRKTIDETIERLQNENNELREQLKNVGFIFPIGFQYSYEPQPKPQTHYFYKKKGWKEYVGNLYLNCHPNVHYKFCFKDIQIGIDIEKEEDIDEIKECLMSTNVNRNNIHNLREMAYRKLNERNYDRIERLIVPFDFDVIDSKLKEMGYESLKAIE